MDKRLYDLAFCAALRVEFLDSKEEFEMYVKALCQAMEWGKMNQEKRVARIKLR
jgi:hypothetical protein